MKYNNVIFLGLCLGLTTYSALSADSVIKISGRVLDYGCTVSSDSLNFCEGYYPTLVRKSAHN